MFSEAFGNTPTKFLLCDWSFYLIVYFSLDAGKVRF
jgi:hypothetical protein